MKLQQIQTIEEAILFCQIHNISFETDVKHSNIILNVSPYLKFFGNDLIEAINNYMDFMKIPLLLRDILSKSPELES